MLGAQESEVKLRFAGLNHMVWVHKVLQGREDVTGKVLSLIHIFERPRVRAAEITAHPAGNGNEMCIRDRWCTSAITRRTSTKSPIC